MQKKAKIGFLGGGNLTRSLLAGLVLDGMDPDLFLVADRNPEKLAELRRQFGIQGLDSVHEVVDQADILILAVKPLNFKDLCLDIRKAVSLKNPLIISVATGIRLNDMLQWLGGKPAIVRAMPNTPAMLQAAATALFANEFVSRSSKEMAEKIMRSVGITAWLEREEDIESIIAIAGSAPAYYFRIMELMQEIAQGMGLPPQLSKLFITQTFFGSGKMALESSADLAELRAQVTSKGGTTQAALKAFEEHGLKALLEKALYAARDRGLELAEEYGVNRKLS